MKEAEVELQYTKAKNSNRWIVAIIWALILIEIGYFIFHLPGLIAAALAAFFLGRAIEQDAAQDREVKVANATSALEQARKDYEEQVNRQEIFSAREEREGIPSMGKQEQ